MKLGPFPFPQIPNLSSWSSKEDSISDTLGLGLGDLESVELEPSSSISVSRHDDHNIEIKSIIELKDQPQRVSTEVYLFFPKNFEIDAIGKTELQKDLRTRLRLSLPVEERFDDQDFKAALEELRICQKRLEAESSSGSVTAASRDASLEASRDVASIAAERLKKLSREHGSQFFLSQSLIAQAESRPLGFENFILNLEHVRETVCLIRKASECDSDDGRSIAQLLDEYLSQLYVQYMSAISREFDRHDSAKHTLSTELKRISREAKKKLIELQESEAQHRKFRGMNFQFRSELDREQHLIRLSQLKKFFQMKSFIDVTKKPAVKRVTESTALIGTAIAGISAAVLEQWGRKTIADFASQGLILVSLGVILYVLRDRMKDWARSILQQKAMSFIPDFETVLDTGVRKIGISREWLQILQSNSIPSEISQVRHNASVLEPRLRLPEDALLARRVFYLSPAKREPGEPRALHENVRINLDRHLKHMDDPFKEFTDLEANGRLKIAKSHRVYHFTMVIRSIQLVGEHAKLSRVRIAMGLIRALFGFKERSPLMTQQLLSSYRIVVDKSGVKRVEAIP